MVNFKDFIEENIDFLGKNLTKSVENWKWRLSVR